MANAFGLSQETGEYVNGGLRFRSNDLLERLFVEKRGEETVLTMPYNSEGSQLTITSDDGQPFSLESLDLSKATFGEGIAFEVLVEGRLANGARETQSVVFPDTWMDREDRKTLTFDWSGLEEVRISAPFPFGIGNVRSSEGIADFDRRRPFYVAVACEDARLGFEHFPFATIHHPQVLVTGNGGGHWYNSFQHGDIWANPDFRFIEVRDNREPLNIYHWHLQHVHSEASAALYNAVFVSVFGFKSEHNSRFLEVRDSDHIRLFGWGGLADAAEGGSHFLIQNTPNFLHAAMAEEPHFMDGSEVLSSCDNPLIIRDVETFDGIQEIYEGEWTDVSNLARTILFQRGQPINGFLLESFSDWKHWTGRLDMATDHFLGDTKWPDLLQFAYRLDLASWLNNSDPLAVEQEGSNWLFTVSSPLQATGVEVFLRSAARLDSLSAGPLSLVEPQTFEVGDSPAQTFLVEEHSPWFLRLEATLIEETSR
jgi:hypothetical protein